MRRWLIITGGVAGAATLFLVGWILLRPVRTETVVVNPPEESLPPAEEDSQSALEEMSILEEKPASDSSDVASTRASNTLKEPEAADAVSSDAATSTEAVASQAKTESSEDDNDTSKLSDSKSKLSVTNKLVSFGYQTASGRKVDAVVIHSTYNPLGGDPYSVSKAIDIYKSYSVSPHYIVARDGKVYRLVEEKNIAYHAGDSKTPDGRTNVNAFSIGIEVLTKETGDEPTDAQYIALRALLSDIKSRYSIKYILGHSDIAPGRKSDPWGFDWKEIGGKKK